MKFVESGYKNMAELSLPSRERGLKLYVCILFCQCNIVAPFAGAWIEIFYDVSQSDVAKVAPFAGAWIEMTQMTRK